MVGRLTWMFEECRKNCLLRHNDSVFNKRAKSSIISNFALYSCISAHEIGIDGNSTDGGRTFQRQWLPENTSSPTRLLIPLEETLAGIRKIG
jgi:hypothetical protein